MKRFFGSITVMILALAGALVFGEMVVRFLYKDVSVMFPRYHTGYQYGRYTIRGNRPSAEFWHTSVDGSWKFVTNSKGFRAEQEFAYKKPVDMVRVVVLGDSHTLGFEVHQDLTFAAILERYLKKHVANAEVINAGVSGFSNAEELVFLENEAYKYEPDVVVLGFFENDFEDNVKAGLFGLDDKNHLVELKHEHVPGVGIQDKIYAIPLVRWLSENSYFYSILFNKTWHYFKFKLEGQAADRNPIPDKASDVGGGGFEFAVPTKANPSALQVELAGVLIERMNRYCGDRGIRFLVVDIPTMPAPYRFRSSLLPDLRRSLDAHHVEYVSSDLLDPFDGVAEMHVPHGYNHISAFTHTLLGSEIGRRMLDPGKEAGRRWK